MGKLLRSNSGWLLVLTFLFASSALASPPKIDSALKKYFMPSDSDENEMVTVIAMFHDKAPLPVFEHTGRTHRDAEFALRNNARASQMATMQKLFAVRDSGETVGIESLWLVNAAIFRLPASELRKLAKNEDISWILANRKRHIYGAITKASDDGDEESPRSDFTYGLSKISLPQLREKAPTLNGSGVKVGILDTGIEASHPDLKERLIGFKDFVNDKKEPYDDNGHGTHVSGTIAGGNSGGVNIGVAPSAKIIMAKVFSSEGFADDASLLKAMQWIADPDGNPNTNDYPQVVSNSWGGGTADPSLDPMEAPFCKAIDGWVKVGMLPVFAAGNEGPSPSTVGLPGGCPQALTIGATDKDDQIASFSSRGPVEWKTGKLVKPNVVAPGVDVESAAPGGGHQTMSGTSMATPHAAGLAALVVQAIPNISVENMIKVISAGADPLNEVDEEGGNNTYGAGRINALKTLQKLSLLRRD